MAKELAYVSDHHRVLTGGDPQEADWPIAAYLIEHGYASGEVIRYLNSRDRDYDGVLMWKVLPKGHDYVARIEAERAKNRLWRRIAVMLGGLLALGASVATIIQAVRG